MCILLKGTICKIYPEFERTSKNMWQYITIYKLKIYFDLTNS